MRRHTMLTAVVWLLAVATTVAQPHYKITNFRKLNDAVTQVNRIVRDGQGMMWFATNDGIYRYDGYEFRSFKSRSGDGVNMQTNDISYLYASSEGGLWCVASKRAFLFDTNSYRYIDVMKSFEAQHHVTYRIKRLRTLPCGTTWLFTDNGKIFVLQDARPEQSVQEAADYDEQGYIAAVCDVRQRSWVLTSTHTHLYQNGKLTTFDQPFRKILADGKRVWLLSGDGRLSYYDESKRDIRPWRHGLLTSPVEGASTLAGGRLALFTSQGMLLVSADGKQITQTPVRQLVNKVFDDGNGHLWIFGQDGWLGTSDLDCKTVETIGGFHAGKCDFMRDKHGSVWVFADNNETYCFQNGQPENFIRYDGEKLMGDIGNTINDGQGGYWFIHKHRAFRLTFESPHYALLPLHQPDQVRCVVKDQQNRLLVGTRYDETVTVFAASGQRLGWLGRDGRIHNSYTPFGASIYSGHLDADGNLWLGTKMHGLFRLRMQSDGSFAISQYAKAEGLSAPQTISDNEIYCLLSDRHHRLWIATHKGGLCCIKDTRAETPYFVDATHGLPGWKASLETSVRALLITPNNKLLVGGYVGLLVADISGTDLSAITFKSHTRESMRKESLSSNSVTDIVRSSDGRIFLATTDGGINELLTKDLHADRFDFCHYNRATGFPVDITLSMVENNGSLWGVAPNQLVELQLKASEMPVVSSYLLRENPKFASCRPVRLKDDRWVFGSEDGAILVSLDHLKSGSFVPPLVVTGYSKENGAVDYAVQWNDTITLAPHERDLTVWFSALDYENTELVAYAYRMDKNKHWTYIGQNHSITLAQMQPGRYQMTIRSTNSDGAWCDNERTLTIIVTPTFWETPWAKLLLLGIVALVSAIIVYTILYIRRIKRNQHQTMEAYLTLLERLESEKVSEPEGEKVSEPEGEPVSGEESEDDLLMKRVVAYMEDHLADSDVTIDDIAQAVALSRTSLHRKMKQMMGTTPIEFLREARIRKASKLLTTTEKNVSEIAYLCGFSDPKYFSKCFKATFGQTPTEYKMQA